MTYYFAHWRCANFARDSVIFYIYTTSSTSFQSIKTKTRCIIQMTDIDNHKSFSQYIPNNSCSSLGSQVSTDASTASSQRLKPF